MKQRVRSQLVRSRDSLDMSTDSVTSMQSRLHCGLLQPGLVRYEVTHCCVREDLERFRLIIMGEYWAPVDIMLHHAMRVYDMTQRVYVLGHTHMDLVFFSRMNYLALHCNVAYCRIYVLSNLYLA